MNWTDLSGGHGITETTETTNLIRNRFCLFIYFDDCNDKKIQIRFQIRFSPVFLFSLFSSHPISIRIEIVGLFIVFILFSLSSCHFYIILLYLYLYLYLSQTKELIYYLFFSLYIFVFDFDGWNIDVEIVE